MRCLVTAGPTYEPLDTVRRLTNFSSGRLGSDLARFLTERGHEVTLLLGEQATYQPADQQWTGFSTTADLAARLREAAKDQPAAIFHAAAVSDFQFGKVWLRSGTEELIEMRSGKISTREGTLLAELIPTTKIIRHLREWFPDAKLVGWKFEVEGDRRQVLERARAQVQECRTDACVANGPAYGAGFGLIAETQPPIHLAGKPALFEALGTLLTSPTRRAGTAL